MLEKTAHTNVIGDFNVTNRTSADIWAEFDATSKVGALV